VGQRIINLQEKLIKEQEKTQAFANDMEVLADERAKQLVDADRMVTLGTMSAGIAHEINNPTTFISGNAQSFETFWPYIETLIKERGKESKEVEKLEFIKEEVPGLISGIKNGAERITKIVKSLKTFAHHPDATEHDQHDFFKIQDAVNNALVLCHNKLKYNIKLNVDIEDNLPEILGDSQQIEQVIVNILNNAADAVNGQKSAKINIDVWHEEGLVSIKISDNGSGIKEEHLGQIFNPFFTTKSVGSGTGLGMSISHGIIQAHKGALEAGNNPDKGAFFHVILPVRIKKIKESMDE
jgi:C4-dicarboxylate-specific signal transduction histidine kinase